MINRKILIALNLLLTSLFVSCIKKGESTIYLIPEGYRGAIEVVYNQDGSSISYKNAFGRDTTYSRPLGEPQKYESSSRVYMIPKNGILLTQFKENSGVHKNEYYYIDSSGNRKKLNTVSHADIEAHRIIDGDEVAIFHEGDGGYGDADISYTGCLVCSLNELKTKFGREYYSEFNKQVKEFIHYGDF